MTVETKSGIKTIEITLENDEPVLFKVDMGTSTFKTPEIPMASDMDEFFRLSVRSIGHNIQYNSY